MGWAADRSISSLEELKKKGTAVQKNVVSSVAGYRNKKRNKQRGGSHRSECNPQDQCKTPQTKGFRGRLTVTKRMNANDEGAISHTGGNKKRVAGHPKTKKKKKKKKKAPLV